MGCRNESKRWYCFLNPRNTMNLSFLSKLKLKNHFEYGEHLRPIRDWMIMLACFGVLFILTALWNVYVFYRAVQGEAVGGEAVVPTVTTDEIISAQETFMKRKIEEEKYQGEYHFVDPS